MHPHRGSWIEPPDRLPSVKAATRQTGVVHIFHPGKNVSGESIVFGQLFAATLPQPKNFALVMKAEVALTRLSVDDLVALPPPHSDDD